MRPWILVLPLIGLANGCTSAPQANTQAAAEAPAPAATANSTAAPDAAKPHGSAPVTTTQGEADPAYSVVDESQKFASDPAMLAKMQKAIEHVKVPPPAKSMKVPDKAKVQLVTSKGNVTVELNGKEAPLHTKSFLHLSKIGFYDNTIFHRFADLMGGGAGRIIQGGDPFTKVPTTREYAGMGGPGYQVPRENNKLKHTAMVLAAARSSDPNSAGSQFYLTLDAVSFLDDPPGYTVFGKVTAGQDVVLKLKEDDVLKKIVLLDAPKKQN